MESHPVVEGYDFARHEKPLKFSSSFSVSAAASFNDQSKISEALRKNCQSSLSQIDSATASSQWNSARPVEYRPIALPANVSRSSMKSSLVQPFR
ncbi:hypothetical protein MHYP_G00323060 [Metynnis hypsauchen]